MVSSSSIIFIVLINISLTLALPFGNFFQLNNLDVNNVNRPSTSSKTALLGSNAVNPLKPFSRRGLIKYINHDLDDESTLQNVEGINKREGNETAYIITTVTITEQVTQLINKIQEVTDTVTQHYTNTVHTTSIAVQSNVVTKTVVEIITELQRSSIYTTEPTLTFTYTNSIHQTETVTTTNFQPTVISVYEGQQDFPLRNINGYLYNTNFTIGNQEFELVVDTGSGDLWIPEENCISEFCLLASKYYYNLSSPELTDTQYSLYYVSGNFDAKVIRDTVSLGSLTLDSYGLGLATEVSSEMVNIDSDGIIGFAYYSVASNVSFPKALVDEDKLTTPIFSFFLNRDSGSTNSILTIGGDNPTYYTGNLDWVDSAEPNDWSVRVGSVRLNQNVIATNFNAYVDSGTTTLAIPEQLYAMIQNQIPAQTSSCSLLPNLTFTINNINYTLGPKQYSFYQGNWCHPNIFPWSGNSWILGSPFLQSVYTSFNIETNQLGFAPVRSQFLPS